MSFDAWKSLALKGEAPEGAAVYKTFTADEIKAVDGEERAHTFTLSTATPDRDRDVIGQDGWKLNAFKKNPVVLWAHSYDQLPLGKASKIKVVDGKLQAKTEWAPAEANPFAEQVHQLIKGGFLSAVSVGFKPLKWNFNEQRGGIDFQEQELLEFSVVPVPANAEALIESRAYDGAVEELEAWATKTLETLKTARMLSEVGEAAGAPASVEAPDPAAESPAGLTEADVKALIDAALKSDRERSLPTDPIIFELEETEDDVFALLAKEVEFLPAPAPTEDLIDVSPELLLRTAAQIFRDELTPVVQRETRRAMTAFTGRLD
jgi:HK97 family phage prohead protease